MAKSKTRALHTVTGGKDDRTERESGSSEKSSKIDYSSGSTTTEDETGSYWDERTSTGGVQRRASGSGRERSTSFEKFTGSGKDTEKEWFDGELTRHDTVEITTQFRATTARTVETSYSPSGMTTEVTEDSNTSSGEGRTERLSGSTTEVTSDRYRYTTESGVTSGHYWHEYHLTNPNAPENDLHNPPEPIEWAPYVIPYDDDINYTPLEDDPNRPVTTAGGDGGVLSWLASASLEVGVTVIETWIPSPLVDAGLTGVALLALAGATAIDPAVQDAYDELGPLDTVMSWFFSDLGEQWDMNRELNRAQQAANGQLRVGSFPSVAGGTGYTNAAQAHSQINAIGRQMRQDAAIEVITAGAGGVIGRADDVNDLRKAGKFQKPLVAAAGDAVDGVRRFKSFDALKRALGAAGEGKVWHHIVEQSKVSQFGAEAIHNTMNVVAVPREVNQAIANYYSRIRPFTDGQAVRQWLKSQSYAEQSAFGQRILDMVQSGSTLP